MVTRVDSIDTWKKSSGTGQKRNIQVLVDTPMACHGTADCGVCAVKTKLGWKNVCSDGPVFQLAVLDI
jgi:NAD(P)H-flavin reductase